MSKVIFLMSILGIMMTGCHYKNSIEWDLFNPCKPEIQNKKIDTKVSEIKEEAEANA